MHSGHQRQQPVSTVPNLQGFKGDQPAPVVFIQPFQQEVEQPMVLFRPWVSGQTFGALATPNTCILHGSFPP